MARAQEGTVHQPSGSDIPNMRTATVAMRPPRRMTYLPMHGQRVLLALTLEADHVHTLRTLSASLTLQAGRFVSPHDVVLLLLEWAGQQRADDGPMPGVFDPWTVIGVDKREERRKRHAESERVRRAARREREERAALRREKRVASTSSASSDSPPPPPSATPASPSSATPVSSPAPSFAKKPRKAR